MEGAGASEPPAARAARYLRAQLRLGSTAAFVFWGVVALLGARSAQRGGPEAHASTDRADDLQRGHQYFLVIFSVVGFLVMQVARPKIAAILWVGAFFVYGVFAVVVSVVSSEEQAKAIIEKFATDDTVSFFTFLILFLSFAGTYSQPVALRTRFMSITGHLALRTLQGPILYARLGPLWAWKWLRFSWLPIAAGALSGWLAAALFWHSRASRAVACAAHADSLDERYGSKSARRVKLPNSMLQTMVDNLKAEVYEVRLRLMSARAAGSSDESSGESAATHREEELCEGDIRGSFAEGA